jgi:regulator of protease activity HflC (stomatin/prohibitin superfamily)
VISLVMIIVILGGIRHFHLIKIIQIQTGQIAINMSNGNILEPGLHMISPVLDTYIISQVSGYAFDIKTISAESSELQDVFVDINLTFRIEPSTLRTFYEKNGIKSIWDTANTVVTPKAIETIKEIVRQYSFKEVQKKTIDVKNRSLVALKDAFRDGGIHIEDINIVNIAISSQYAELEKEQLTTQNALEIAKRETDIQILRAE